MRVVLDLALEAAESSLFAAQHEQLQPARRHRTPGQSAAADCRRSLDPLRGLGESAL
jgi:hypothetical protein